MDYLQIFDISGLFSNFTISVQKLFFSTQNIKKGIFCGQISHKNTYEKNGDFSKGVSPSFRSKIGYFSIYLFKAIQDRRMCSRIVQNAKTPVQAIKTRNTKSRKIEIFPKGLVHGFGQKLVIFHLFLFGNIGQ